MADHIPLNPPVLLEVLQAASSQSQELVQRASGQLKAWEKEPGFWQLLQDAFLDHTLPVELRWIAIITLKQGVDKYWRKSASNSIPKQEKQLIRSRLLSSSIDEPSSQLAVQNAVIVAKVARLEYPLEWPKVFTEITGIISEASQASMNGEPDESALLRLSRSLSILLHVVKELATGRLIRTKTSLQTVTPDIITLLGEVYFRHVQVWQNMFAQSPVSDSAVHAMSISLLTLKIIRRLIVGGYEFPNRSEPVNAIWLMLYENLWTFYGSDQTLVAGDAVRTLLRRHVLNAGKLFLDVNSSHPAAFALLPNSKDMLGKYWAIVESHGDYLVSQSKKTVAGMTHGIGDAAVDDVEAKSTEFREKVALQGMLLFRGCLKMVFNPTFSFKCRVPTMLYRVTGADVATNNKDRHKEEKEEVKRATDLFQKELFTPEIISRCMEVLVLRYFILRPSDIEGWAEDPEAWNEAWDNSVESWEFMVRPCAEKLFNDLMVNFKSTLVQPLVNVFNQFASAENEDLLQKDAIYAAVGIAASVIHPNVNFDQFIHSTVVHEIQISQSGYNILRRRDAILLGQWVSIKISDRPVLYKIYQHLLNRADPMNDLVVRLTAAHNLRRCIEEWDFRIDAFLPYVDDIFDKIMGLIDEVEQTESKMGLLDCIGSIVNALDQRVANYAQRIVDILPGLWDQTGEEHLFKQAILAILSKLVEAMKDQSVRYHHMVIPLIRYSVEPGSSMQVYLLEDALELWASTIAATPTASQELIDLFPYLIALLDLGTLTLRRVLDIIESYVILAPREIISNYREPLLQAFSGLLGEVKPEANCIISFVLETMIRTANDMGGDQGLIVVGDVLVNSSLMPKVFSAIYSSHMANQTTGPNKKYPPPVLILTDYYAVLSRMVLANSQWFLEVVGRVAQNLGQSPESVIKWILDEWIGHFGNIGHPKQRKLNCLALTALLETNQRFILERLQDLFSIWTDVVTELQEEEGDGKDSLIYWKTQENPTEPETPERTRRNDATYSDPVHTINVGDFIRDRLHRVQNENGGPDAFRNEWLLNVDHEVLKDFSKLGLA